MIRWTDLFLPRQLMSHCVGVEIFLDMLEAEQIAGTLNEIRRAAFTYLALCLDKMVDYNSRVSAWHGGREVNGTYI